VRDSKGNQDLWLHQIERGRTERLTSHPGDEVNAVWSPDLKWIAFNSRRKGDYFDLYKKQVGGFEEETLLYESSEHKRPQAWSQDGKDLLFFSHNPTNLADIWIFPMETGGKPGKPEPEKFLVTQFDERNPRLSPNQQWVLYQQNRSGQPEVYAMLFLDRLNPNQKRISNEGGTHPRWSPDGKKVYYLDRSNYIVSAEVRIDGTALHVGAVERLFEIHPANMGGPAPFDIHPDGQRFLVNEAVENTNSVPATVVLNWTQEFQKK